MNDDIIDESKHKELIAILKELISTIELMKKGNNSYLLYMNGNEAKDWLEFLLNHRDKDELQSLEKEIADRFVHRFDVQIERSELDYKRTKLMEEYMRKSYEYTKTGTVTYICSEEEWNRAINHRN